MGAGIAPQGMELNMPDWTLVDTDILIDAAHQDDVAVLTLQSIESLS